MKLPQVEASETIAPARSGMRLPLQSGASHANPAAIAEPFHAITQAGYAVADVANKFDAVQQKLDDENARAEALKLYTGYVKESDDFYSNAKLTADPDTAYQTFAKDIGSGLDELQQKYRGKATSDRVQKYFNEKTTPFTLERYIEARRHQDKLTVDYHESALDGFLSEYRRQIAKAPDEQTAMVLLGQGNTEIEGARRILGNERVTRKLEDWKTMNFNMLARQSMARDPEEFLGAENGGRDGYKRYEGGAKPEYMETLKTQASAAVDRMAARERQRREDQRHDQERALKEGSSEYQSDLLRRLNDPTTPLDQRPTTDEFDTSMRLYHTQIPPAEQIRWREEISRREHGVIVSTPGLKDQLKAGITFSDPSVSLQSIGWHKELSNADKVELGQFLKQAERVDDISHSPFYHRGRERILIRFNITPDVAASTAVLGQLGVLLKPEEKEQLDRALVIFDTKARDPKTNAHDLPVIAGKIVQDILGEIKLKPLPGMPETSGAEPSKPSQPKTGTNSFLPNTRKK